MNGRKSRDIKDEAQESVIERIVSGNYEENLAVAMSHAILAVRETSTVQTNYLLQQSMAQSLIAIALMLEDIAGHIIENGERQDG